LQLCPSIVLFAFFNEFFLKHALVVLLVIGLVHLKDDEENQLLQNLGILYEKIPEIL
jgi:hypothetical protein